MGTKSVMIDETGNRYGKLTVISRAKNIGKHAAWQCKCDCGNEHVVKGSCLRSGGTKSCGCIYRLPEGEAVRNALYRAYKNSARKRNFVWDISMDEFIKLTKGSCYYCGIEPRQASATASGRHNGNYIYNGIDRVDNSRGYTRDNTVSCCGVCNSMKHKLSYENFMSKVEQVYFYRKNIT